jgi:hypothetical protein
MDHGLCIDCAEAIGTSNFAMAQLTRSIWSKGNLVMIASQAADDSIGRGLQHLHQPSL